MVNDDDRRSALEFSASGFELPRIGELNGRLTKAFVRDEEGYLTL
jgi:hypothetical protein